MELDIPLDLTEASLEKLQATYEILTRLATEVGSEIQSRKECEYLVEQSYTFSWIPKLKHNEPDGVQ